jgi:hypothetical protein
MVVPPAVNGRGAGSSPAGAVRSTGTCSWESSAAPTRTQRVQILPSLLVCPWPSSPGTTLPGWTGGCDPRRTLFLVSWSSGVLATLTWWRTLVRIQPGRLTYSRGPAATAPGSRPGDRRFESCREYCGVDWSPVPARSHTPLTPVRIRPPQLLGAHVPRGRGCFASTLRWVRFPSSPLMGPWSNGKTLAWRAGDAGSIPAGSTLF